MDYGHPLQFGALITPASDDPQAPVERARLAERLGFDLAVVTDQPDGPQLLDAWTVLSWVAGQTERICLSAPVQVLSQPVAVLARAAASLDLLVGGRIALALAAEAAAEGDTTGALGEAIDIIRGIWDAGNPARLRVDGTYYQVDGARRGPAPAHDIGIWVGALKPRMLRLIGAKADGWLPSLSYISSLSDVADANAIIDDAAHQAGRQPAAVRRLLNIGGRFGAASDQLLSGPPGQWAEQLAALTLEYGFTGYIVAADDPATISRFGQEVAPAVRELVAPERAEAGAAGPGDAPAGGDA